PTDSCPQQQQFNVGFGLVSAGLLPASAPEATPGAASYLFRISGLFAATLSSDQISAGLSVPTQSLGWRLGPRNVLVVDVAPSDPIGRYTLSFALPDGRQASIDFGPHVTVDPVGMQQVGRVAPSKPSDPYVYAFHVSGTDVESLAYELGVDAFAALVKAPTGSTVSVNPTWGHLPALVVAMPQSIPDGMYSVTFTLPNGRSATASFQHTH
ncbi:MAG: hypothetical protein ACYDCQ_04010, partial [Dehalococcoidia bacterium]